MTLREVFFSIGYNVDNNSEKKAEESINGLKSLATKALGAIGIGLSVAGLTDLAQTAADMKAASSQFEQVFDGFKQEATDSLNSVAKYAGATANRMKGSFNQIAAFAKTTGMETSESLTLTERAMKATADSSAFYDRSLEDVTASLQSFLKGNYENDAALGLSCTETTRNAAANELYGKSFKDLSESQKQFTLLKMVEDANATSGALGQASREADTWTNQLGNMKQGLTDLKAAAGNTFLKPAVEMLKIAAEFLQIVTNKINSMSGTTEQKANVMTRKIKEVWSFLKLFGAQVDNIVEKFGGWEKILKVLAIAAGIFAAAFAFKKLQAMITPTNLKIMGIVAAVVLLAMVIEDFINFMQGNDSVIGKLFEKAGIDADAARTKITEVWTNIKGHLLTAWESIKQIAISIFGLLQKFWDRWGGTIIRYFTDFWNMLSSLIDPFLTALNGLLMFIEGVFSGNWTQALEGLKQFFQGWIQWIINLVTGLWTMLSNLASDLFGPILEKIKTGFESVVEWFLGLPDMAKQWMHDFVTGLITGIQEKIGGFIDTIKGIGEEIAAFLHFSVPDKGPLTEYESWMPDFMTGLAKGIKDNMPMIKNAVKEASEIMADMGNVSLNGTTALKAIGGNTRTNNVNQTNEYNIHVSGTDPQTVNNTANALKDAGGDNTSSLADALAYGL